MSEGSRGDDGSALREQPAVREEEAEQEEDVDNDDGGNANDGNDDEEKGRLRVKEGKIVFLARRLRGATLKLAGVERRTSSNSKR